jgi:hypothetical protein
MSIELKDNSQLICVVCISITFSLHFITLHHIVSHDRPVDDQLMAAMMQIIGNVIVEGDGPIGGSIRSLIINQITKIMFLFCFADFFLLYFFSFVWFGYFTYFALT